MKQDHSKRKLGIWKIQMKKSGKKLFVVVSDGDQKFHDVDLKKIDKKDFIVIKKIVENE